MKVSVSVHGRFHAFELAAGLHKRNTLSGLMTTYPGFAVRRLTGTDMPVHAAWWLEAKRRLMSGSFDPVALAKAFGRFAAKNLPVGSNLLVGWSSATLEVIEPAQSRDIKVIIERGSSHIAHQTDVLTRAYADRGLVFSETPPAIVEREEAEYEAADSIAVPSTFAKRTFIERGISENKLIVNPYGVDLVRFKPSKREPGTGPVKILSVGRVGIRKGIVDLITAFQPLAGKAELHLVGPVEPVMRKLLNAMPMEGVQLRGPFAADELPAIYQDADIFCLPSLEEGFPLVLLQAMASGLAVVATPETGAEDIITEGTEGHIVNAGDSRGLGNALAALVEDAGLRPQMGLAARARVENGWGWENYVERAMVGYQTLLG